MDGLSRRAAIGVVVGLSVLTLGVGLGGARRLSYHEAIWAQSARELVDGGGWLVPTLDGRPWLEKPPLGTWLIAGLGRLAGGVDEGIARVPSAVAAGALALAVAWLVARRRGWTVGGLAGAIQATTAWTVQRGRLAEADVLLAALVAGAFVAFDRLRQGDSGRARGAFFGLLGATALVKGVGFGAALVGVAVVLTLFWDRDRDTLRRLVWPTGMLLAALVALAWPLAVLARRPEALGLWVAHVADRLGGPSSQFAGESWAEYAPAPLAMTLPWAPLALAGAVRSWRSARGERGGLDRLLWAWAVGPAVLVSLASVRNSHYLIHALPPWSAWAATGLVGLGERLRRRGWSAGRVRRGAVVAFAGLGLAYALGFALLGRRIDARGAEWAWYAEAARKIKANEQITLIYNYPDWDRFPYATPFGPMPHDLAVRLFYLGRPAAWRNGAEGLAPGAAPFAVIGRDADLPALRRLGRVEVLGRGPAARSDRAYLLARVTPRPDRLAAVRSAR